MHGSSRNQRLGWHLLLALFMLLMQHGALRHAYHHSANNDQHPAHGTYCKECLSYTATDVVAPTTQAMVPPPAMVGHPATEYLIQHWAAFEARYQSRAPPRLCVQA